MYELYLSGMGSPAEPAGHVVARARGVRRPRDPEMRDIVDQIGWQYGWTKSEAPTEWWHVTWTG